MALTGRPDGPALIAPDGVVRRIDELGFKGWIGCEYRPAGATEDGLGWFAPYRT